MSRVQSVLLLRADGMIQMIYNFFGLLFPRSLLQTLPVICCLAFRRSSLYARIGVHGCDVKSSVLKKYLVVRLLVILLSLGYWAAPTYVLPFHLLYIYMSPLPRTKTN